MIKSVKFGGEQFVGKQHFFFLKGQSHFRIYEIAILKRIEVRVSVKCLIYSLQRQRF
jgi:hypothetical protein